MNPEVNPVVQLEDLCKGLVALCADDILLNRPPLSQHVAHLQAETRRDLKTHKARAPRADFNEAEAVRDQCALRLQERLLVCTINSLFYTTAHFIPYS